MINDSLIVIYRFAFGQEMTDLLFWAAIFRIIMPPQKVGLFSSTATIAD
jgi:hypothetical protein